MGRVQLDLFLDYAINVKLCPAFPALLTRAKTQNTGSVGSA
jgi:hypothetical protein